MTRYSPTLLRLARKTAGLTALEASDAAYIPAEWLRSYESGRRIPSGRELTRLAVAYSCLPLYDDLDADDPVTRLDGEFRDHVATAPDFTPEQVAALRAVIRG